MEKNFVMRNQLLEEVKNALNSVDGVPAPTAPQQAYKTLDQSYTQLGALTLLTYPQVFLAVCKLQLSVYWLVGTLFGVVISSLIFDPLWLHLLISTGWSIISGLIALVMFHKRWGVLFNTFKTFIPKNNDS